MRRWPRLHRAVGRLVTLLQGKYEDRFFLALQRELRLGDCLWDVGANVGEYVARLSPVVGTAGHVVAIEPAPECVRRLKALASALPNVTVIATAMSDQDGEAQLSVADGPTAVSNKLRFPSDPDTVTVAVNRGDTLVDTGVTAPNVLKIDVEGFEQEVLRGLPRTLADPSLRAVFLEMHFSQLDARGLPDAARAIVETLRRAAFKVQWVDPSHLIARRP